MDLSDSKIDDVEPDWKRIERDMTKVGLKNGLSEGRDSNFQRSFDKGYQDGFQNGVLLGKLKFQRTICKNLVGSETAEVLDNASKGLCIVCTADKENEDVADIRKKQSELLALSVGKIEQNLT